MGEKVTSKYGFESEKERREREFREREQAKTELDAIGERIGDIVQEIIVDFCASVELRDLEVKRHPTAWEVLGRREYIWRAVLVREVDVHDTLPYEAYVHLTRDKFHNPCFDVKLIPHYMAQRQDLDEFHRPPRWQELQDLAKLKPTLEKHTNIRVWRIIEFPGFDMRWEPGVL